jgi:rare lipoprotein A
VGQLKPARSEAGRNFDAGLWLARLAVPLLLMAGLALNLSACGGGGEKLGERVIPFGQPVPKGGGVYQIGKPYQVGGQWYTPKEEPGYDRVGSASWYGEMFHGRHTANGEIYDMDRLSAAHPTLPLPVYARVTNLNNGRSIVVRINDRGPYARDRIIDLSRRSAEMLGFRGSGTATVRVKYLGRAPLSGDDGYERKYLASQSWVQVAAKASPKNKNKSAAVEVSSIAAKLPAENPENLALPWKAAAPRDPAQPVPAASGGRATTKATDALPPKPSQPQTTGSLPAGTKGKAPTGPVIQAGSFKSKDNADRARDVLLPIAAVDVTAIAVGADTYYRVRVGPFGGVPEARAALARVAKAGYRNAKIVATN